MLQTFHNHGSGARIDIHGICENVDWHNGHLRHGDVVCNTKNKIQLREGILLDQQRLTFSGKQFEDERMICGYNIIHESELYTTGRLKGGATMSAEEITNALGVTSAQLQQVQTALAAEQATTADLRQHMNRGGESGGIAR